MQLELPCMRWREDPPTATGGDSGLHLPPEDVDGVDPLAPPLASLQLQKWAMKQLAALHKDAGPALVHQQILRAAVAVKRVRACMHCVYGGGEV